MPGSGLPVQEGAFKALFVATPQIARNWATHASLQTPHTLEAFKRLTRAPLVTSRNDRDESIAASHLPPDHRAVGCAGRDGGAGDRRPCGAERTCDGRGQGCRDR